VRRAAKRQAAKEKAETRLAEKMTRGEPRMEPDDRRQQQRRQDPALAGEALEKRLRALGIVNNRRRAPGDRR
jgi:hypothetical protein